MGNITIRFWPEVAPNTVSNFKELCAAGFYDGTCFHRVVKGFVIQGGDPSTLNRNAVSEWGSGGPGYTIPAEFNDRPHRLGVVSMARSSDPDSAGSQFFICLGDATFLDGRYTAFGEVVSGHDVLSKIGEVAVKAGPGGECSLPIDRVHVNRISIVPAA